MMVEIIFFSEIWNIHEKAVLSFFVKKNLEIIYFEIL